MSMPPPIQPPPHAINAPGQPIPNYLAWSITITIVSLCLCCIIGTIPGIVAIVFSSKVNSALTAGDLAGAKRASDTAKLWCWITTGLCILGLLINIVWVMSGGVAQYQEMLQAIEAAQG